MGACGLRIIWIYTIFVWNPTIEMLYFSYPVSWLATTAAHVICLIIVFRKYKKAMSDVQQLSGNNQ